MQRSTPNYIGLVKAAGLWDMITNAASSLFGNNKNQESYNQQGLNIGQQPTQQYQTSQPTYYNNYNNSNLSDTIQQYTQWYQDRVNDYKKENQHQERQQEEIQDAKRLMAENNEKSQRDKQMLDQQRAYANQ